MEEISIARIREVICDNCPDNVELIDCAKRVVLAAVGAGIPEAELRNALNQLYGE